MDLIFFDIWLYNWTKAAFVASLRSIFGSNYVPPQYKFIDNEEETKILIYTAFPYRVFKTPCVVVDASSSNADVSYVGAQEHVGYTKIKEFRIVLTKSPGNVDPIIINGLPLKLNDIESIIITGYDQTDYKLIDDNDGNALIEWFNIPPNPGILLETYINLKQEVPYLYFTGILKLNIKIDIYTSTVTDAEKLTDIITTFLRFFLRDKLAELRITYTAIDISGIESIKWNEELLYHTSINIRNCYTEYELIFPESLLGYISRINLNQEIKNILNEKETIQLKID